MTHQELLFDLSTHEDLNAEQSLRDALTATTFHLDMTHGFITSLQPEHSVSYSYPNNFENTKIKDLAEPLFRKALKSDKVFAYQKPANFEPILLEKATIYHYIAAPIIFKGNVTGILAFCRTSAKPEIVFTKDDYQFIMALSRWVSSRFAQLHNEQWVKEHKSALGSVIHHSLQAMMLIEKAWNPESKKPDFKLLQVNSAAKTLFFKGKQIDDGYFFELIPELKSQLFTGLNSVLETTQPFVTSLNLQKGRPQLHLSCIKVNNQLILSCLPSELSLSL